MPNQKKIQPTETQLGFFAAAVLDDAQGRMHREMSFLYACETDDLMIPSKFLLACDQYNLPAWRCREILALHVRCQGDRKQHPETILRHEQAARLGKLIRSLAELEETPRIDTTP